MSQLSPKQVQILNGLAVLQISCGRPSSALPFLNLCHQLAPNEPHTCYLLANVYHRLGKFEESMSYIDKYESCSTDTGNVKALLLKSIVISKAGAASEARMTFKNALKKISQVSQKEKQNSLDDTL